MKQHQAWADEYLQMIDDCVRRDSRLSDWERTFLDSLQRQLEDGKTPSPKQLDKLNETWERVTARG